jgi:hypothetical protein
MESPPRARLTLPTSPANPVHYYHLFAGGNWQAIANAHFDAIDEAGFPGEVRVGLVGDWRDRWVARDMVTARGASVCAEADFGFEQVTLRVLGAEVQAMEAAAPVLYAHTKGAHHNWETQKPWREEMTDRLLRAWPARVADLRECDTTGVWWLTPEALPSCVATPYYAGNFWWATAGYLKTLPPVSYASRGEAEAWLGRGNPRAKWMSLEWPPFTEVA